MIWYYRWVCFWQCFCIENAFLLYTIILAADYIFVEYDIQISKNKCDMFIFVAMIYGKVLKKLNKPTYYIYYNIDRIFSLILIDYKDTQMVLKVFSLYLKLLVYWNVWSLILIITFSFALEHFVWRCGPSIQLCLCFVIPTPSGICGFLKGGIALVSLIHVFLQAFESGI